MYSDGLLKLPIFTIQKNFKILLTVYSLSPLFLIYVDGAACGLTGAAAIHGDGGRACAYGRDGDAGSIGT